MMAENKRTDTRSHLPPIAIPTAWSNGDDEVASKQSVHQTAPVSLDSLHKTRSILAQTPNTQKPPQNGRVHGDTEKVERQQSDVKSKDLGTNSKRVSTASAMSSSEARMVFSQMKIEGQLRNGSPDPWTRQSRRNTDFSGKNHISFAYSDNDSKTYPKYISNRTELLRRRRSTSFCYSEIQDQLKNKVNGSNNNKRLSNSDETYRRPSWNHSLKGTHPAHSDLLSPVVEQFHQPSRLRSYTVGELHGYAQKTATVPQLHWQKSETASKRTNLTIALPDPTLRPRGQTHWTQNPPKRRNSLVHSVSFERQKEHPKIPDVTERKARSSSDETNNDTITRKKGRNSHFWKLKREHSFEITYPGYDSRFKEFSPMCIAVGGEMDTAIQQLRSSSVEKCKKWLHNVPTTPEILN